MKNTEPKVYLISGLGLNERVFARLSLNGLNVVHLPWIEPRKGEALSTYAQRMLAPYISSGDPAPVIVGLSFGGIIAVEIAKLIPVKKVIIISSIKHHRERPFYMSLLRWIPVYFLFSYEFYQQTIGIWGRIFGIHSKAEEKIFLQMFARMSNYYVAWATNRVLTWKNTDIPPQILHIHGKKDKVFPALFIRDAEWIESGDHGMIVHKPRKLSQIIKDAVKSLE